MTNRVKLPLCSSQNCGRAIQFPHEKYCPECTDKKSMRGVFYAVISSIVIFGVVFFPYFYHFNGSIVTNHEVWGQFGDFIGGVLNPFIGLITIYLIYRTFHLQRRELKEARTQFETSAVALSEQKDLDMFYQEISLLNNSLEELDKELDDLYGLALYLPTERGDLGESIVIFKENHLKERELKEEHDHTGFLIKYLLRSNDFYQMDDYVLKDIKIKNRAKIKSITNTLNQVISCFKAYETCNKPKHVLPTLQNFPRPNQIKKKHRALVDFLVTSTLIDINYNMSFQTNPLFTDDYN